MKLFIHDVGEDLRVPCIVRRSSQSTLKEINPEYSLEGLRLRLKLQYFGHPVRTADSLEKTLMLGKMESKGWQRTRGLDSITSSMDMNVSKAQGAVKHWEAWPAVATRSQSGTSR